MSENSTDPALNDTEARQLLERQLAGLRGDDTGLTEEAIAGLSAYIQQHAPPTVQEAEERFGQDAAITPRERLQVALAAQRTAYHVENPTAREHAVEQANRAVWSTWREFLASDQE